VLVAWGRASASELLRGLLGEPVVVRHLCPACGSSEHGRPWLRPAEGGREELADLGLVVPSPTRPLLGGTDHSGRAGVRAPDVSIAHAGGLTLVGLCWSGRVGVDLEPLDAAAPAGVRHANDPDLSPIELWVRKEAYLKATGDGLRRPMDSIALGATDATWGLIEVPGCVAARCWVAGP